MPAPRTRPDTEATDRDRRWLELAIELSKRCRPSMSAFSVGAIIVDERGGEISRGFSRELPEAPRCHAEESALRKLALAHPEQADPEQADPGGLGGATLYSSLEPCARRASGPPCTDRIIAAGIGRVVIAWREPPVFVPDPSGVAVLTAAGVAVVEPAGLAERAAAVNAHLLQKERQ